MKIPEMLAEYETRLIKDKLLEIPDTIKNQKAEVRDARENYNEAAQAAAMLEADLATDIAAEMDPSTGKPKFSNDKTRQSELMKRKAADADYRAARQTLKEAEYRLGEAQDELEALQDKYKSYRYVAKMTAAELNVWANVEDDEEKDNGDARYMPTKKGLKASDQLY